MTKSINYIFRSAYENYSKDLFESDPFIEIIQKYDTTIFTQLTPDPLYVPNHNPIRMQVNYAPQLKLKAGKTYRTKSGLEIEIVAHTSNTDPYEIRREDGSIYSMSAYDLITAYGDFTEIEDTRTLPDTIANIMRNRPMGSVKLQNVEWAGDWSFTPMRFFNSHGFTIWEGVAEDGTPVSYHDKGAIWVILNTIEKAQHACHCNIISIMREGCKCGGK